jgi:hypothetical protein
MADEDKFVVHQHPDPGEGAGGQKAVEKLDGFLQASGQVLSPEEQQQKKIRRLSKDDLRRFVQDLIAELSRRTCEEHVQEIVSLRNAIAALQAGQDQARAREQAEAEKASLRSEFNAVLEQTRSGHEAEMKRIQDEADAQVSGRRDALTKELDDLRRLVAEREAKLASSTAQLEALNVELAAMRQLDEQLKGGHGKTRVELEKMVSDLKARIGEYEVELEYFAAVEDFDAEAFSREADELAGRLDAQPAMQDAVRQAAADARTAASAFAALKEEMEKGVGSIWVVVDMVKHVKACEAARARVRMIAQA